MPMTANPLAQIFTNFNITYSDVVAHLNKNGKVQANKFMFKPIILPDRKIKAIFKMT